MKKTTSSLAILFALMFSIVAQAEEVAKDLLTRYTDLSIAYKLNEDGSSVEDRSWSLKVLKEQALESSKQFSFTYSTSVQKAEIQHAYTLKANGRRIDVSKDNYQLTVNGGKDSNLAIFSDRTTLTVVFPELEVGDTAAIDYRIKTPEAIFPGQFSDQDFFYKDQAYDHVALAIDFPKSMKLRYSIRDMEEEKNVIAGDRHLIAWSWTNSNPLINKRRDYGVYNYDEDPGYIFSTFTSNQQIAEAYGKRAIPKTAVTPRIKTLAEEIAKGKSTDDEVARSLYEWVSVNITYAGNCVGIGTVVPHDLDFILDNRMGDCKDHATLLQALLTAKGIQATQALVNAGSAYKLPKIPVVSMVNHVINYLPKKHLFLDSTSTDTPYGMLPFVDQDKSVLLVENYQDNLKTPVQPINTNEQIYKSTFTIDSDGSAKGETKVSLKGAFASDMRSAFRRVTKDQERDIIKNNFKRYNASAEGEFSRDDPKELTDRFSYVAQYAVKDMYKFTKTGALNISPLFFSDAPVGAFLKDDPLEDEHHDFLCRSGKSVEEFVYEFPKDMQIISVPDDIDISDKIISYKATYHLDGTRLIVKRVFDDLTQGNVCSEQSVKESILLLKKAKQNYNEQVIYKKVI